MVTIPDCPEVALFVTSIFQRLGGIISVSDGKRRVSKPEPALYRMDCKELPQMPDALPHERFHSDNEWRGALKLADYLLSRISDADADLVFQYMASVHLPDSDRFDFRRLLSN